MKVSEDEKKNQIALSLIEGVGDKIGKKLLAYFGSVKAIFLNSKIRLRKSRWVRMPLHKRPQQLTKEENELLQ